MQRPDWTVRALVRGTKSYQYHINPSDACATLSRFSGHRLLPSVSMPNWQEDLPGKVSSMKYQEAAPWRRLKNHLHQIQRANFFNLKLGDWAKKYSRDVIWMSKASKAFATRLPSSICTSLSLSSLRLWAGGSWWCSADFPHQPSSDQTFSKLFFSGPELCGCNKGGFYPEPQLTVDGCFLGFVLF